MSESLVLTDPLFAVRQTVTFTGAAGFGQVGSVLIFNVIGKAYIREGATSGVVMYDLEMEA